MDTFFPAAPVTDRSQNFPTVVPGSTATHATAVHERQWSHTNTYKHPPPPRALTSSIAKPIAPTKGRACRFRRFRLCPRFFSLHLFVFQMDGLSCLAALEELWLCRNRFTEVGDGLPLGPTLREINVSHNRLGCFKELLKLAPLEGLRSLALQDAHFGDNPVCGLSNYKTYVAYHLTQVKKTVVKQERSAKLLC